QATVSSEESCSSKKSALPSRIFSGVIGFPGGPPTFGNCPMTKGGTLAGAFEPCWATRPCEWTAFAARTRVARPNTKAWWDMFSSRGEEVEGAVLAGPPRRSKPRFGASVDGCPSFPTLPPGSGEKKVGREGDVRARGCPG